ncbi:hypothetical protein [Streptomyces sp. NPDC057287]|uniref:hypothetical protein n=1 Tax=Streptomyces sp. NPDC057287 TaxID=3346086 RepID=UPI00362B7936
MIDTENLEQLAVRNFVDSLNTRDERAFAGAVIPDFVYTSGRDKGGAADFFTTHTRFVVTEQSEDGCALTGVMVKSGQAAAAHWRFTPRFKDVFKLHVDPDVELPDHDFADAMLHLGTATDAPGTQEGTVRRMKLGEDHFVHRWGRGGLGRTDWINTGEKANDPVYKTFHSGERRDEFDVSRVTSQLSLDLDWDGTHQKATARFHATLKYWDAVAWLNERLRLADETTPVITATLTLTGPPTLTVPDGKLISTEKIRIKGHRPPYPLDLTREYSLTGLTPGTCTLTLTDAVKTGGSWTSTHDTTVKLTDHTLTFPVGN